MNHTTARPNHRLDALRVRDQAAQLLTLLTAQRAHLEQVLDEQGRNDQIKAITGTSALDNAIESTRSLIRAVDRTLEVREHPGAISPRPRAGSRTIPVGVA